MILSPVAPLVPVGNLVGTVARSPLLAAAALAWAIRPITVAGAIGSNATAALTRPSRALYSSASFAGTTRTDAFATAAGSSCRQRARYVARAWQTARERIRSIVQELGSCPTGQCCAASRDSWPRDASTAATNIKKVIEIACGRAPAAWSKVSAAGSYVRSIRDGARINPTRPVVESAARPRAGRRQLTHVWAIDVRSIRHRRASIDGRLA
jgi:hypothetical protein